MKLIYQNFDGLDITFQGVLPLEVLEQLEAAKTKAQETRQASLAELGPCKLTVMVGETGASGGYRYRFDTGPDGETWFAAHSTKADMWNIRVSAKSLALALYGYEGVKDRILSVLQKIGAHGKATTESGLLERISRFDYAFDFLSTQGFTPDPTHIIAHQRCTKGTEGEKEAVDFYTDSKGDTYQTIRVGKMPGRQATIYNKSAEIQVHNKTYWKDLWRLDSHPPGVVWRVEVRVGKDELDKWGLKRFSDFKSKAGDVITSILEAIRYVTPTVDSNRARWPVAPFWQVAHTKGTEALAPYISHANREAILRDYRLQVVDRYHKSMIGSAIGATAAAGRDVAEVSEVLQEVAQKLLQMSAEDPKHVLAKFKDAENRFRFLI